MTISRSAKNGLDRPDPLQTSKLVWISPNWVDQLILIILLSSVWLSKRILKNGENIFHQIKK
uniref:Putative ovule protein n=1 Tax=Solanum chacoense TaxID=4108 RepID=A0A0V0GQE2_SOLCH